MVFWRRSPRKGIEDKGNLAGLAQFAARVLGSLAIIALLLILVDQFRHFVSDSSAIDSYSNVQREKYAFACYQHSRVITAAEFEGTPTDEQRVQTEQVRTELAVYQLMDEARQQIAPADFWGKLRLFALCSNFSKVGFSGFEVAGSRHQVISVMRIQPEDVDEMYSKTERWKSQFPTIADSTLAELRCELIRLKDIAANMNVICVDQRRVIRPEPVKVTPDPTQGLGLCIKEEGSPRTCVVPTDGQICACKPEDITVSSAGDVNWARQWLLVTGADQSYEATQTQVKSVTKVLTKAGYNLAKTPVEVRKIRSWKRTVVVFPDEAAAQSALDDLITDLPYGGYIRSQKSWCPDYDADGGTLDVSQELSDEGIADFPGVIRQCVKRDDN